MNKGMGAASLTHKEMGTVRRTKGQGTVEALIIRSVAVRGISTAMEETTPSRRMRESSGYNEEQASWTSKGGIHGRP